MRRALRCRCLSRAGWSWLGAGVVAAGGSFRRRLKAGVLICATIGPFSNLSDIRIIFTSSMLVLICCPPLINARLATDDSALAVFQDVCVGSQMVVQRPHGCILFHPCQVDDDGLSQNSARWDENDQGKCAGQ